MAHPLGNTRYLGYTTAVSKSELILCPECYLIIVKDRAEFKITTLTSCFIIFNNQFSPVGLRLCGYCVYSGVFCFMQQIISRHRERGESHSNNSINTFSNDKCHHFGLNSFNFRFL